MRRNIIHLLAFLSGCSVIGMAQSNAVIEYNVPSPHSRPFGITSGPDGALWFTEQYQGKIGRITTTGSFTEYALTAPKTNAQVFPIGITVGPDQALWFAAESYIGRITTGGAVTLFPEGIAGDAVAITNGPDGALWFVDAESVSIGRMPPGGTGVKNFASANAKPNSIVTGPDGNLWFTSYNDQIGRLTPRGRLYYVPACAWQQPRRDHRRTQPAALVHRNGVQQDRQHHHRWQADGVCPACQNRAESDRARCRRRTLVYGDHTWQDRPHHH